MAEGGGLLNRYTVKSCIQGSNPCLTAIKLFYPFKLTFGPPSSPIPASGSVTPCGCALCDRSHSPVSRISQAFELLRVGTGEPAGPLSVRAVPRQHATS